MKKFLLRSTSYINYRMPNKTEESISNPRAGYWLLISDVPEPLTFETKNTKWVFSILQSVQKVKNVKFNKPYGIMEQKSELLNYIFKVSSNLPSKN